MDANQIKYINSDIIKDVNQVLEVGSKLRVSKFNSPFTVKITRERMTSEVVYPESTIYESDPELSEGKEVVDVVEQNGKRDVVYEDVIVNGAPKSSEEIRTQVTKEPIRGKVRYGTKVEPRIGSGNYRWPLDNANISCVYGNSCYYNHNGTDFVLNGGGFGPIYAVDRGVVSETVSGCFEGNYGCGSGWGNHIVIDHGNGYTTLYAHMATGPYFNVGDLVKRGDNIGYMGMTGTTYGPHVHLEFRYHGVRVDPCTVMGC
ncbi:peptidoglycan DD-metalloendopeptidase family protein [Erysipelothrix rhusiopathiae]|nr:peptidoglycan DD-metalloendopeptidase family protein [Erysipelothrix rhusiopathiae]MDE8301119.1 peptidoglycan DD-metalloendopeptidase family protein [Erysipelothrix rhusiopathiae]MDE8306208.1 peptidoglycan DD-metalloendopeptidase family protein [Erysipelothrix rhusiopathiae]